MKMSFISFAFLASLRLIINRKGTKSAKAIKVIVPVLRDNIPNNLIVSGLIQRLDSDVSELDRVAVSQEADEPFFPKQSRYFLGKCLVCPEFRKVCIDDGFAIQDDFDF